VQLPYKGTFTSLAEAMCLRKAEDSVFLAVTNSYLDESFDPKHDGKHRGIFAVGGVLGRGDPCFALECSWEKRLKKYGLTYFKASHCENGWKQFSKFVVDSANMTPAEKQTLESISLDFINAITNPYPYDPTHYLTGYGVGVMQEDFYEVIKDDHARAVLGDNPYRLTYDIAFIQGAWLMKQTGDGWAAHFVCDEHEIYSPLAPAAYYNLTTTNSEAAQYMLSFSSIDEKKCAPVQAADALVYEVRRALNFKFSKDPVLAGTALRKQFEALDSAHCVALISHILKEQLEWIAAKHKPGEPFKLDELMKNQLGDNVDQLRV
jgi:hypothetical protein